MAKKGPRVTIKLESPNGDHVYFSQKNTRNTTEKMELMKYNPVSRKHEKYKEGKMK